MELPDGRFYYSSQTVMPAPYPKYKYHATEPPREVRNEAEEAALGPEWGNTYIAQPYPKMLFKGEEHAIVSNPDEEKKLGHGWSDKAPAPVADKHEASQKK